jgi:hypothetical protein
MERAGVPKKTIDAITKNPLGSASAKATAAHIKRVKDVNGLSSKQKTKYNEKMDMATPGMSPEMKHQDAIAYALDPKAARPRSAAGREAAISRFGNAKGKEIVPFSGRLRRPNAAASAAASEMFDASGLGTAKIGMSPNNSAMKRTKAESQKKYGISAADLKAAKKIAASVKKK